MIIRANLSIRVSVFSASEKFLWKICDSFFGFLYSRWRKTEARVRVGNCLDFVTTHRSPGRRERMREGKKWDYCWEAKPENDKKVKIASGQTALGFSCSRLCTKLILTAHLMLCSVSAFRRNSHPLKDEGVRITVSSKLQPERYDASVID